MDFCIICFCGLFLLSSPIISRIHLYAVQYLTSFNGNSVSKKFVLQSRSISDGFLGLYTAVSQGILLSTKFMQSHHMGYYPLWPLLALNQDLVARLGHPWNLWKKLSCIGIIMQASLDWNMEWYSECTQLQLTCAPGTAVLFNQGWASYYITAKTYKMTMSAVSGFIEQVNSWNFQHNYHLSTPSQFHQASKS